VLLLHGYSGSGSSIARNFAMPELGERRRFVWAAPDGTMDKHGARFWNTGPACCDFDRLGVDHVTALRAILDEARAHPSVDPNRLYVIGYSNGGFMAQRLACEVAPLAGVASIAGMAPADVSRCPATPRVLIHVHGDADTFVRADGGTVLGRGDIARHPSVLEGMTGWARRVGCDPKLVPLGTLDLEAAVGGPETRRLGIAGCPTRLELWRVAGGEHNIVASRAAFEQLLDQLMGAER
jgi:polyhydroxybutyrate depolymerase